MLYGDFGGFWCFVILVAVWWFWILAVSGGGLSCVWRVYLSLVVFCGVDII